MTSMNIIQQKPAPMVCPIKLYSDGDLFADQTTRTFIRNNMAVFAETIVIGIIVFMLPPPIETLGFLIAIYLFSARMASSKAGLPSIRSRRG